MDASDDGIIGNADVRKYITVVSSRDVFDPTPCLFARLLFYKLSLTTTQSIM